jgi:acid phosphatase type 7
VLTSTGMKTIRLPSTGRVLLASLVLATAMLAIRAPAAGAATLTVAPDADARVSEGNASTNYGTSSTLRVDAGSDPDVESYLRFTVANVSGPIQSARLRLFASSSTGNGPAAFAASNAWTETGINWGNRPAMTGDPQDDKAAIASGAWVEWNVTALVTGNGTYSFALAGTSTDGIDFGSREGSNKPSLVLEIGTAVDTGPPTAPSDLTATATGPTRVDLSWTASLDDQGISSYDVYRGGAFLATSAGPGTTYSDTSVAPSTTYSYHLIARDTAGRLSGPSTAAQATTPAGSPTPITQTFTAAADARVSESSSGTNYGTATTLRVDAGSDPDVESFLRFSVGSLSGTVQSALLRVYASSGTADGPAAYSTSPSWQEAGITWSTRPARSSGPTDDKGSIASGRWIEWNVTPLVAAGASSFVLAGTSTDGVDFQSREAANKPELLVTTANPVPDAEPPSAPANLTAAAPTATRVNLSWEASRDDVGVTGYDVYRDQAFLKSVGAETTTTDQTVVASTPYAYHVVARDASGKLSEPSNTATVTTPETSPDPVIAAAGDIACAPSSSSYNGGLGTSTACRQRFTSDLLVAGVYAAVLALGDLQYPAGAFSDFQASYDPTWGRVKTITKPVPGNHEYQTANASGYYSYFGPAAGDPANGYYSFDVGSWHIVALNSNCSSISGGCGAGSPQETWLRADLAAHPTTCALAYWHHPRWSSAGGGTSSMQAIWKTAYDAGVDVALAGHVHNYERFAPQGATGALNNSTGVREFVVGTGGANLARTTSPITNSQVLQNTTFGVLELSLHATSYDWRFVPEAGKTFTDSGSTACH